MLRGYLLLLISPGHHRVDVKCMLTASEYSEQATGVSRVALGSIDVDCDQAGVWIDGHYLRENAMGCLNFDIPETDSPSDDNSTVETTLQSFWRDPCLTGAFGLLLRLSGGCTRK